MLPTHHLCRFIGDDSDGPIYLSVLGEVYDVTTGKEFYGIGSGYSYFAGRDGSVGYFTGDFTEEGMKNQKSILEYSVPEIKSIESWREFYETHETYSFIGLLQGEYYDVQGGQTPYLQSIVQIMKEDDKPEDKKEL